MPTGSLTIEQVLTLLAATPARLAALSDGLAPAELCRAPRHDEWSANDVLAHLRACADVWGNCIARIIAEDKPTLRAISPRTWIRKTDYLDLEFQPSLRSFSGQRTDLLQLLEPLPRDAWARTATVTGAGNILEWTVLFYAERLALHERAHIKQIEQILAAIHSL
jgi:hypothetical protein